MVPGSEPKRYCEWEVDSLTLAQWRALPVSWVSLAVLVPAQPCLVIDRFVAIAAGGPGEDGDECLHAVLFDGVTYLHNGHHRWALALARGARRVPVRVRPVSRACAEGACCGRILPGAPG